MKTLLFLQAEITDPLLISRYQKILDDWSSGIHFAPIKKLGSDTKFISATQHAIYTTKVKTQIEKRWLKDHESPYHDEDLPTAGSRLRDPNPASYSFQPYADFERHSRSENIFETRRVNDCPTCLARGEVVCSECSGPGEVNCNSCDGYGHKECSDCDGKGQITDTRTKQRREECSICDGKGRGVFTLVGDGRETRCDRCNGRGYNFEDYEEEYYVPCLDCASSGKITCNDCRGKGKVTCTICNGSGKETCYRCDGHRRLLSYRSVEVVEEPVYTEHICIPKILPAFKKTNHPLSKTTVYPVFTQDEPNRIHSCGFAGHPAEALLKLEFDFCRANHTGNILRERVEIEASFIVEYRYLYQETGHKIYINAEQELVEDPDGPIQSFIASLDQRASCAFETGQYEECYRLATRALCMDEPTAAERTIRDRALAKIKQSYAIVGAISWFGMSALWVYFIHMAGNHRWSPTVILGCLPLIAGINVVCRDFALRLPGVRDRIGLAVLMGITAFLAAASIGDGDSWDNWIGFGFTMTALVILLLVRQRERNRRSALETHFHSFGGADSVERYVLGLDPQPQLTKCIRRALLSVIMALLVPVLIAISSEFRKDARIALRVEAQGDFAGKLAEVSVSWKGTVLYRQNQKVNQPENLELNPHEINGGELVIAAPGYEEVKRKVLFVIGVRDMGTIHLSRLHGTLSVRSSLPAAQYEIRENGKLISDHKADAESVSLPTGQYTIIGRHESLEEVREITLDSEKHQTLDLSFPRGRLKITVVPSDCTLLLRRGADGPVLIRIPSPVDPIELSEGRYEVTISAANESVTRSINIVPGADTSLDEKLPVGDLSISAPGAGPSAIYKISRGSKVESTGTFPAELHNYLSGDLQIVASDALARQIRTVSLPTGGRCNVVFQFSYGQLQIDSTPSGALYEITNEGGVVTNGNTPLALARFPTGEYRVTLHKGPVTQSHDFKVGEAGPPVVINCFFPVGNLVVANGPPDANYYILAEEKFTEAFSTAEPRILPEGNYVVAARYHGIVAEKAFTISPGQTTVLDFLEKTGSLMVRTNRPGSALLRSVSGKQFSLETNVPTLIECLPFGDYTIESGGEIWPVKLSRATEQVSLIPSRKIEQIIPARFLGEMDADGMRVYNAANCAAATRIFSQDMGTVWRAVFNRACIGILRQQPYVFDQQAGWMIGIGFDLKSKQDGKHLHCRHIAILTDMGSDGVKVEILSQTFLTWNEVAMDRTTGQYAPFPHAQPLFDAAKNQALSRAFLDDIEGKLGPANTRRDFEASNDEKSIADTFDSFVASVTAERQKSAGNDPVIIAGARYWKTSSSSNVAKAAIQTAIDACPRKWKILSESSITPQISQIQLGLKGLMAGNRYHLLIQIAEQPNQPLDIRSNLVFDAVQTINDPPSFTSQIKRAGNDMFKEYTNYFRNELAKTSPVSTASSRDATTMQNERR